MNVKKVGLTLSSCLARSGYRMSPKREVNFTPSTSRLRVSSDSRPVKMSRCYSCSLYQSLAPAEPLPVIESIKKHGMLAGLAISPQTPSSAITDEAFHAADMILVMTVHPGAGGQKFMPECLEKARELRKRFNGVEKHIQVDGGVGPGNICDCAKAGECAEAERFGYSGR